MARGHAVTADNVAYLVPPGKIRCFITGDLRTDTPEENVRQRWVRSLAEEYGYPKEDIGVEATVRMGRARKRVDIAVYASGAAHKQENIDVVIEVKRDDMLPSDNKGGDGQLISYMAACPACRFGLWVGSERRAYEKIANGRCDRVPDIPRFNADRLTRPTRGDLVRTHELKSVFRRCHNYIYANAGLQKAEAFHELLKLIFCKTFDEEESGNELLFGIDPQERRSTSGQRRLMEERIAPLFQRVQDRYPLIFDDDDQIKLEGRIVAYVVSEMQFLSLLDTETDIKGEAYEELVGANLRGDRGEYFTPRNVCDMAVRMAMSLFGQTDLTSLKVLDCCCGTGGFLVSWLNNLYAILLDQEQSRPRSGTPEERARHRVHGVCTRNLYGLDINPNLVRTCQMNLVLHGDGSSNIHRVDSTRPPGEWNGEERRTIPYGEVDILFTNPPFGGRGKIDDGHVLGQYELPTYGTKTPRSSMPAEQLFVETALRFVKPGGYLVIVVPDGVVNNPGLEFIRSWLLRRSRIVASVGLPKTTFVASKGINNPTVLIVRKLSAQESRQADNGILEANYNVFMSTPRTAGINSRMKPIYLRQPDGREMVDDGGERILDDEIKSVAERFRDWLAGESSI